MTEMSKRSLLEAEAPNTKKQSYERVSDRRVETRESVLGAEEELAEIEQEEKWNGMILAGSIFLVLSAASVGFVVSRRYQRGG